MTQLNLFVTPRRLKWERLGQDKIEFHRGGESADGCVFAQSRFELVLSKDLTVVEVRLPAFAPMELARFLMASSASKILGQVAGCFSGSSPKRGAMENLDPGSVNAL